MGPQQLTKYLQSVAAYIEETPSPSRRAIVAGLQRAMREMQAGRVTKFVDSDVAQATHGLDALVEKLTKAAKSLNPQSEAKAALEHSVANLQKLKAGLSEQIKELASIDI
jgi:soluble cytochrome b562